MGNKSAIVPKTLLPFFRKDDPDGPQQLWFAVMDMMAVRCVYGCCLSHVCCSLLPATLLTDLQMLLQSFLHGQGRSPCHRNGSQVRIESFGCCCNVEDVVEVLFL